jgi:hypothetical protein
MEKQVHIPLIDSIPYIKDWISQHPQSGNPNSILLCGFGKSLNRVIHVRSLNRMYENYKHIFFPKLLDNNNPNVPPEDKHKIGELLKKPWNPYIRRMVLTYDLTSDAYSETLESEKQKEYRVSVLEKQMQSLVSTLSKITEQGQVNAVAQTLYSSGILKEGNGTTTNQEVAVVGTTTTT